MRTLDITKLCAGHHNTCERLVKQKAVHSGKFPLTSLT